MVPMIESIASELSDEAVTTRRVLERVPADKLAWKPHQRSKSLGELAMHVASIPAMAERIAKHDEFAAGGGTPAVAGSAEEILAAFERNVRAAEEALDGMTEQTASGSWRLIFRGKEVFSKPRVKALRTNMLNHMYHHRGQLTVYLRLLDVPVPMVYGPTADENPFA